MNGENANYFADTSTDLYATVGLTEALESGRITAAEYAERRYNVMGRSDVFRSQLKPLFKEALKRIRQWIFKPRPAASPGSAL